MVSLNNSKSYVRRKNKRWNSLFGDHHIIPYCISKDNNKENKVLLTFKEHYICHLLLCQMVEDPKYKSKMYYAVFMLQNSSDDQLRSLSYFRKLKALEYNRKACALRNHKPNLGNKHTDETKKLLAEQAKLRRHTQTSKDKIKENNIRTNESRAKKVSDYNKGKIKSSEHRQKIAESVRKYWKEKKMVPILDSNQ